LVRRYFNAVVAVIVVTGVIFNSNVALARDVILYCYGSLSVPGSITYLYIPEDVSPTNLCWFSSTLLLSAGTRHIEFLCYSKNINSEKQAASGGADIPGDAYPNRGPFPQSALDRLRQVSTWGTASNAHDCAAAFQ
jgi:hypothetical protein